MKKTLIAIFLAVLLTFSGCSFNFGGNGSTSNDGDDNQNNNNAVAGCVHEDEDDDGICDNCDESVLITLDFYAINDLHGMFSDTDTQPGVDELTTYLKDSVAADDNAILLSSGDMWQGSFESSITRGALMTEWMNDLDFVSMTIGNHEYDWGSQYLESNLEIAEFPFLAINIFDAETNERVSYCDASVIIEKDGVKIGIIGAIGDCYSSIAGDKSQDVYFKTGSQLTALVKAESTRLRSLGAEYIVYSIHDGYGSSLSEVTSVTKSQIGSYYDVSLSNGYVDLVFEGHTHQNYILKDQYGVYHLQAGGYNAAISHVEVELNYANDTDSTTVENISSNVYSASQDDDIVQTLMTKYDEDISIGYTKLGKNDVTRYGDTLRALVAQLYCATGLQEWGDEYDIVLGGGYISIRTPGYLPAGDIYYSDIFTLFPFENAIHLCSISGEYLQSCFLETANSNYFVTTTAYGESLRTNIDLTATYYVVVDSYSSSYAPNHLTVIDEYEPTVFARDLIADYIEEGNMTTVNDDTPDDYTLTSIPELLSIGNNLANNGETQTEYYVKGTVISIASTTYGNMTIEDEQGNTLYVYGVYDSNGARYDSLSEKPQEGDVVILCGPIKKYVNNSNVVTIELFYSELIEIKE